MVKFVDTCSLTHCVILSHLLFVKLTIFLLSSSYSMMDTTGWSTTLTVFFGVVTCFGLFVFKEVPFDAVEDDIAQSWFPDSPELFSNECNTETVVSTESPILLAVPYGTTLPPETVLCHPITGMNGMHFFMCSCIIRLMICCARCVSPQSLLHTNLLVTLEIVYYLLLALIIMNVTVVITGRCP